MELSELLTRQESADLAQITTRTLDKYIASRELRVIRIGACVRIAKADLQSFLDSRRTEVDAAPAVTA